MYLRLDYDKQVEVMARIRHFVDMGNEKFNTDLDMDFIRVRFDKRGTTAGTALYENEHSMELDFNVGLMVDNWDDFMNDTIPHEVSHLFKNHMYGTDRKGRLHAPHGVYWQNIMRGLGVEPSRCHSMDVSKVAMPKTKHVYGCPTCGREHILSQVRHNKLLRGRATYWCCTKAQPLVHQRRLGKITNREAVQHKNNGTVPAPEMKKAAQSKKPKAPAPGTKIARAMEIYKQFMIVDGSTRGKTIAAIALALNITGHQAATYYQNCKKRAGV